MAGSCGERPDITDFADSAAGIELAFVHSHAMISDDLFEEVMLNCPRPMGQTDCYDIRHAPPADPATAADCRGPWNWHGNCTWFCPLPEGAENAPCCAAQKKYEDRMGLVNIYGVYDMCKSPPPPPGSTTGRTGSNQSSTPPPPPAGCPPPPPASSSQCGGGGLGLYRESGPRHVGDTLHLLKPHRQAARDHELFGEQAAEQVRHINR